MLRVPAGPLAAVAVIMLVVATVAGIATASASVGPGSDAECESIFDLDGPSRLFLPATENATVMGRTDWSADTNVSIRLRFPDGASRAVVRNDSVIVDENGRWTATVNLSGVEVGRTFVAWVQRDGEIVDAVVGEVGTPTATVTVENQSVPPGNTTVVVRNVSLELGGFVAIHENTARGPIVGVSGYLEPGTHETVTVELDTRLAGSTRLVAMAHKDSDCNTQFGFIGNELADSPYVEDGTAVTDAATVHFATPTPTPTPTPSPTPTSTTTPTPSPTDPAPPTTTPAGSTTTGPGFGIGAALAAVVGGAVLLWRTR